MIGVYRYSKAAPPRFADLGGAFVWQGLRSFGDVSLAVGVVNVSKRLYVVCHHDQANA